MTRELETQVINITNRTYNVKSVRFALSEPVDFQAGQFMFVTLKSQGKEISHPLSISNSPTEKGFVEFTKKLSESEFSQGLCNLKIGDPCRLKLPFGQFTLKPEIKKIIFIAGGIGITPIRSMIKFASDYRMDTKLVLLYSNHRPEDIVFKDDFAKMEAENPNLKVVHTITGPEEVPEWNGRRGYINEFVIKETVPDYPDYVFYLCGPPRMTEAMIIMLKERLCVPPERIIIERFSGY
ncbi:MAG: ferredoxin--NADP reductase [Candidatus Omnitrophota bacterium]